MLNKTKLKKIISFERKRDIKIGDKWNKDNQYGYIEALRVVHKEL